MILEGDDEIKADFKANNETIIKADVFI